MFVKFQLFERSCDFVLCFPSRAEISRLLPIQYRYLGWRDWRRYISQRLMPEWVIVGVEVRFWGISQAANVRYLADESFNELVTGLRQHKWNLSQKFRNANSISDSSWKRELATVAKIWPWEGSCTLRWNKSKEDLQVNNSERKRYVDTHHSMHSREGSHKIMDEQSMPKSHH